MPIPIPTPGEILKEEFLDPMGISQNKLSRDLDVPPKRITAIIRHGGRITVDTAIRLAEYFHMDPEFWLALQVDYDLRMSRRSGEAQAIKKRVRALDIELAQAGHSVSGEVSTAC